MNEIECSDARAYWPSPLFEAETATCVLADCEAAVKEDGVGVPVGTCP